MAARKCINTLMASRAMLERMIRLPPFKKGGGGDFKLPYTSINRNIFLTSVIIVVEDKGNQEDTPSNLRILNFRSIRVIDNRWE